MLPLRFEQKKTAWLSGVQSITKFEFSSNVRRRGLLRLWVSLSISVKKTVGEKLSRHKTSRFPYNSMVSPDGSQLALVYVGSEHKITFVTMNDNRRREVELKELLSIGRDWTADSKSVFVTGLTANEIPVVTWVEPNGNHRVLLEGERAAPFWWAIPSPDGRYLALQVATRENNAWMVENF